MVVVPGRRPERRETKPAERSIPGLAVRKAAAKLLGAVVDAKTPLDGLTDHEHGHPVFLALDQRDRALVRAILATALRYRGTIDRLISSRLEKPLPPNAHALSHVLHVAAAQILFLDVPDSAAVDLAVTHANSDPRTKRFAGLVNAVLRGLSRDKTSALPARLAEGHEAPEWFRDRLAAAYGPAKAGAILAAHRIEAPVDFTVKSDPQKWATALGGMVLPTGSVRVERLAAPVAELPGFEEGEWWVQDAAAALPARMLGSLAGRKVADLCAAPGGKTAQLVLAGAEVTAIDTSANRLKRLNENLARLRLQAKVIEADVSKYEAGEAFDAVLLDAPCSSTGTVRRHPDIPWTKSSEDVARLAALQARLLQAATRLVRPGGRIVFSNCSLDPVEGELLLAEFLAENPHMVVESVRPGEIAGADCFITPRGAIRTTPADLDLGRPEISGLDGFFAVRLLRLH
ncbi:transcription antitermination factor NusB [Mesorhizobium sp. BAC0120]|uniref:RsmB/NOP family class I SAM-dependent RNA methyltransferase n=1 Tax=Mesorhizobium sp. BAC0120 TaxID=3090670 RepID=UPI00298CB92C|nr:transcription antitermination factor NusB [Mesorhizobium sp. BAC0120]MDW6021888.1 transcription antitermination factor NusB [Mesorhizobium sp. BAC0120]